jgi:hypothetical protein
MHVENKLHNIADDLLSATQPQQIGLS